MSLLKNSNAPCTRRPSMIGRAKAAWSPTRSAAAARGKLSSCVTSGIQAGSRLFQTRPGRPTPRSNVGRHGRPGELLERESRGMPRPGALHALLRPIDFPDGAALPAERGADRLDHPRRRLLERRRFGQRPRGLEENLLLAAQVSCAARSGLSSMMSSRRPRGSITLRLPHRSQEIAASQRIER